jgi:hypothetical protein
MDISLSQEEQAIQGKAVDQHAQKYARQTSKDAKVTFEGSADEQPSRGGNINNSQYTQQSGETIGQIDPFAQAYLQPALRAHARARPEQPFPPAQLGREEIFLGKNTIGSLGVIGEEAVYDTSATVRLRCLNQQDRRAIDEWWKYQVQIAGKQQTVRVLIGEESGTLQATSHADLPERQQPKTTVEDASFV